MRHTIGKPSTRVTTFHQTSFQSEVFTQSYGPPKSWKFQLWGFRDSHLGVLGQNAIWMLVPWPGTKSTIRGRWWFPPKSESWWVLWVRVCLWLVLAPNCPNYALTNLLFDLCKFAWVNNCLSFFLVSFRNSNTTSTSKVLRAKEHAPTLTIMLFSLQVYIWVYPRAWGRVNYFFIKSLWKRLFVMVVFCMCKILGTIFFKLVFLNCFLKL